MFLGVLVTVVKKFEVLAATAVKEDNVVLRTESQTGRKLAELCDILCRWNLMSCQRFERTCCLCDHGRTDMTVKGADFSETSVDFYQTTLRPIVTKHHSINVYQLGYAVTQLTKQLRKEPEGRGFDPIWGI